MNEVVSVDELAKSIPELVSMGCKFVVEGDVFSAVDQLLTKLLEDGGADPVGAGFLYQLRAALIHTSKPVRAKIK